MAKRPPSSGGWLPFIFIGESVYITGRPVVGQFAVAALSERRNSLRIHDRRSETAATKIKLILYRSVLELDGMAHSARIRRSKRARRPALEDLVLRFGVFHRWLVVEGSHAKRDRSVDRGWRVVSQLAVAALSERRNSLGIQDRRSETAATKIKLGHYRRRRRSGLRAEGAKHRGLCEPVSESCLNLSTAAQPVN